MRASRVFGFCRQVVSTDLRGTAVTAVGVDTIVQEVKKKYRAIKGGSSAVYKQAAIDYPKPK